MFFVLARVCGTICDEVLCLRFFEGTFIAQHHVPVLSPHVAARKIPILYLMPFLFPVLLVSDVRLLARSLTQLKFVVKKEINFASNLK